MPDVEYPGAIAPPSLVHLVELLVNRGAVRRIVLFGARGCPELLPWAHERGRTAHLAASWERGET